MEMKLFKKILLKILLIVMLLATMNLFYKRWFFEKDIQKHSEVINLVRDVPDDVDIIYVGESSNISYLDTDLDKRPISAFVGDYFPGLSLAHITKPAGHAGIYRTLLENIPEESELKTLVVTMNLRSFEAQWVYSRLETALQKSMILLKPYPPLVNRFLLSFKAYDIKSEKEREQQAKRQWKKYKLEFPESRPYKNVREWERWIAQTGSGGSFVAGDREATALAWHYIKGFGIQIDTLNHPRIKDFNKIIQLAEKRGWKVVLHLLPENMEDAATFVGDDLLYLMNSNRDLLIDYFQKRGAMVVDNLYSVRDELFITQDWTTEHYAEEGRKAIAAVLADSLKSVYPNAYREVEYAKDKSYSFFNDCDGEVFWPQQKSITDERAFSAPNSSKTGGANVFSTTFAYPLKAIPDSLKNSIVVDMKIYQYNADHKALLQIVASGAHMTRFTKNLWIGNQISRSNSWEDFHYTMPIPDSIKQADLLKIFLYNPSDEIVFVDDFSIIFQ